MAGGGGDRFCYLKARTRFLAAEIAATAQKAIDWAKNPHHDNTGLRCGRDDCCDICAAALRCRQAMEEFDEDAGGAPTG
jgi:hypothetical protein